MEGAVPVEEVGVGVDAAEGFARGGGADEVGGGVDTDEDLLQEVAREDRLHRRQTRPPAADLGFRVCVDERREWDEGGKRGNISNRKNIRRARAPYYDNIRNLQSANNCKEKFIQMDHNGVEEKM